MNKRIAIQGHPTRGYEVLGILKGMGGKMRRELSGCYPNLFFYVREDGCIDCDEVEDLPKNYTRLTLEKYLDTIAQVETAGILALPQDRDKMDVIIPDDCELVNEDGKWVLRRRENVLWLARDKDGRLFAYSSEPFLNKAQDTWLAREGGFLYYNGFPKITFENSPKKVKLTLL